MNLLRNQKGSSHIIVFVGLAVIVGVSLVGYRVLKNTETNPGASASTQQAVAAPTAINTKADLQKANASLDNTAIDSNVNPNQLDSELNSLL